LEQLRNLLIRLSEHWASYRIFDWQPDVLWTNNVIEQVIGRMKMRSRTVRGYKTEPGMLGRSPLDKHAQICYSVIVPDNDNRKLSKGFSL